jgi:predicted DCC family thiol-disulfide oxidoreductase YuxK
VSRIDVLKALRDHYLRIDARSLGLFRIAFALVLIGDLFRRWRWLRAFYSNEGVLPNHNHLFNLRETGQVWSFLHAFSSPGENHFAFALVLFVYVCFLIGYRTRAFHALALIGLVGLTGRNILLENAGTYAAIAILAFTLFLPCGSRFSLDSLRASLKLHEEKSSTDLNDRSVAAEATITERRLPGWTPTSFAALAVLLQLAVIFLCLGYQHDGAPWKDGSAMHYALYIERATSGIGVFARRLPPGALRALTYALHVAEWMIPALLFLPVLRRAARSAAFWLMAFYGLTFGLLFSYGLFGWALAAAAPLAISTETWDAIAKSWDPRRARTVIYDADCGICLLISRNLKRADIRGHLTFQGNDNIEEMLVPNPPGKVEKIAFPASIPTDIVLTTVVVVDRAGNVYTRGRAVVEVLRALPLGWTVAWILRIPGISHGLDTFYDAVAVRRHDISASIGLGACGLTPPPKGGAAANIEPASPARRTLNLVTGALRDAAVLALFVAMLAQTAKENRVPSVFPRVPQGKALAAIAAWPRMMARWDILAPAPALEDSAFILDGQTKGGRSVDPLTGREPAFEPNARRGAELGQLWSDYLDRLRQKEWVPFQKAFREYIAKGGPAWVPEPVENQIVGFDAYWVTTPSPPPGGARGESQAAREKLFTHSRGGKLGVERAPNLPRPLDVRRPQQQQQ